MLNKKAIAILGAIFLLIVGTLGFLIYQKYGSKKTTPLPITTVPGPTETVQPPPDTTPAVVEPAPSLSGATKLTDDQVVSPVLFFQGNGVTYFTGGGQLFQNDLQNASGKISLVNKRELTIALKSGITKILWPSTGNNFIAELQNGGNRSWSFYDSDKGAYVDLPSQITSLSWLPGGQKIAYIWLDNNGKSSLNIANADNTNYQNVAEIWENDDEIVVSPDGQSILYYERNSNGAKNPINLTTPDGKVFKSMLKDGYNFGVLWSPDSKKFVFGKRDPASQKFQLWIMDVSSGEIKNLGVSGTPDKAVWSSDSQNLYAAVSGSSSVGSSGEKLVKINITSGQTQEFDLNVPADARNLFLDSSGSALFFKNYQDGGLYYVDVSK
jgi:Tol biopolymer transport system component